jgi:hypothetical protein
MAVRMAARWIMTVPALALLSVAGAAQADGPPTDGPHPELVRIYYDYGVAEYCGLVDMPVHNGFALLRSDHLARRKVGREADRRARIDADKAVYFEYEDHGLSGQKAWCRTDGAAAVARFTQYFRTRHLP